MLRGAYLSCPLSSASPLHVLCVLMCFFDDKADLCPIGFAAKRHNSCFYDRMPIKALNVANCRRFFNKYKMCPGNTKATKPRKGKSLQHTKHAGEAGGAGRPAGQLLVCPLGRTHNGPTVPIHCEAAFHLICLLKSSSFMAYSLPVVRHIDSLSKIATASSSKKRGEGETPLTICWLDICPSIIAC